MRKIFVLLAFSAPFFSAAQSVGIGTNTPHNTAMLDISSNSKGLLIPRLTTLQRTSIGSPAIGLTVFDSDTYSYWVWRGDVMGGWQELLTGLNKHWDINGSNIYNTNSGNVGIGTNSPAYKLTINAANPRLQFLNSGTGVGFLATNGTDLRLATNSENATGSLVFNTQGADRIVITKSGLVGIGTSTPTQKLTLNGFYPTFQIQHDETNIGYLDTDFGSHLRIGTNSTNTTGNLKLQTKTVDRVTIDENGLVGIGTSNPTSILSINATDPILQLKNDGVDKGFVQLVGNVIKIGTNSSNTFGTFVVRTSATDRVFVNHKGQMGINIIPNDTRTTLSIAEDDNGNSGIEINYGGSRRGMFNFNGTNTFLTSSSGSLYIYRHSSYPFVAYSDGNFSIGDDTKASGYRLSIHGKAIATEFTALPIVSWPDYVFEKNYPLRPLAEVKRFIDENKHLPNIPSAAQIEKEGIQLGEMSKKLMEKVEELTLYILQQQEQIEELKKLVQSQKSN